MAPISDRRRRSASSATTGCATIYAPPYNKRTYCLLFGMCRKAVEITLTINEREHLERWNRGSFCTNVRVSSRLLLGESGRGGPRPGGGFALYESNRNADSISIEDPT